MSNKKELSELAIANKIKVGNDFTVNTEKERKRALTAAKYIGAEISSRVLSDGTFRIFVLSDVSN